MSRRRRSLLQQKGIAGVGTPAAVPVGAAPPASDEPKPPARPEPEPEPEPEPPPHLEEEPAWGGVEELDLLPPTVDDEPVEEADSHQVHDVVEAAYVSTGQAHHDTTDDSWGGSVWDTQEAAPPSPRSSTRSVLSRPSPEADAPSPGAVEPRPVPAPLPAPAPQQPEASEPEPPRAYSSPSSQVSLDDFFESELFGEEPPTEEVPQAYHEDLSRQPQAPMKVPEPPPLPGVMERYSQAPQAPRDEPPDLDSQRPSYLPPSPEAPPQRSSKPPRRRRAREDEDSFEDELTGAPMQHGGSGGKAVIIAAVVGGGLALLVLILLAVVVGIGFLDSGPTMQPSTPPAPIPSPVVPTTATSTGAVGPAVPQQPAEVFVEPEPEPAVLPAPEPSTPSSQLPAPISTTLPPSSQPLGPAIQPRTEDPPEDEVSPQATPTGPTDAKLGTLKIRSNRRVLVMVNGNPVGYPPLDLPKEPGLYRVSASLPGRPDTQQTKQVSLNRGSMAAIEFSF